MHRRSFLRALTLPASALQFTAAAQSSRPATLNGHSAPSGLKITDMRFIRIAAKYDYPIIRLDTNQGVYGLGEVRDGGVEGLAMVLKPHVIGKNPLAIEPLLDSVRKFAGHRRFGGGYSALDIALHDLAGKVYGVPCWRLLGSQYRDRIRLYADSDPSDDPKVMAAGIEEKRRQGYTFFKVDLGPGMLRNVQDGINDRGVATDKGLRFYANYLAELRAIIGARTPLAADHFGPLDRNDSIRYARAFEPFDLAWAEDILQVGHMGPGGDAPRNWQSYREIAEATTTPIAIGEGLFGLEEGFRPFIDNRAVDTLHPDPLTSGGMRESKRIADYAAVHELPTAFHFAGSPVGCMACVHTAATLRDFVVMEKHGARLPWWDDLVKSPAKPIVRHGFIPVPSAPGLGVELNEDVVRQHLRVPGYFEPTPEYDKLIVDDFRNGGAPKSTPEVPRD